VLSLVGAKGTVLVVMLLPQGPCRFNELRRLVGGVTQRTLTFTLRALERDGLIGRTSFPTSPPRVVCELTDLDPSLREPVEALGRWVFEHRPRVVEARRRFEQPRCEPEEGTAHS
jgi:DNA-binding HxlR family transcriptional regulator